MSCWELTFSASKSDLSLTLVQVHRRPGQATRSRTPAWEFSNFNHVILESVKEFGFTGCLVQTQEMLTQVCAHVFCRSPMQLSDPNTVSLIQTRGLSAQSQYSYTHTHTHTIQIGNLPVSTNYSALDTWHQCHGDSPGFLPVSTPAQLSIYSHTQLHTIFLKRPFSLL